MQLQYEIKDAFLLYQSGTVKEMEENKFLQDLPSREWSGPDALSIAFFSTTFTFPLVGGVEARLNYAVHTLAGLQRTQEVAEEVEGARATRRDWNGVGREEQERYLVLCFGFGH